MRTIRVLIADDHPMILQGLGDFLGSVPDMKIIDACPDGARALQAIRILKPDIAILDLWMPALNGLEVLEIIQNEKLETRIVFLTALAGPRDIITAMAEGAYGLLLKDSAPDQMLRCLRDVAAGHKHLPFELLEHNRPNRDERIPIQSLLTPREWKVMALAAKGCSNKEIGRKLNMTEGTAKIHLHHIFKKTGVNNRTALATLPLRPANQDRPIE